MRVGGVAQVADVQVIEVDIEGAGHLGKIAPGLAAGDAGLGAIDFN